MHGDCECPPAQGHTDIELLYAYHRKPLGTEFADLGLGKEISFVVSENWDDPADKWVHYTDKVIWDESQYDKDSPYEQTITGTLVLSYWKDYIEQPDEPLTLSVKV